MCFFFNFNISTDFKIFCFPFCTHFKFIFHKRFLVIWDHFKSQHTDAQPHAWKLYERSCDQAQYKMFPCFGCQNDFAKINDWNMHKFSRSSVS